MEKISPIIVETSALLLTFRCNLRCKLCCTGTPQRPVEKQVDFPIESLQSVIHRYFEVIQYIRKLSFGGGEPTLYKFLPELIEYTSNFNRQFEVLEIITNGMAIPEIRILDAAEKHKDIIFFMIDDYGPGISKNAANVAKELQQRGVRHRIRCYHGASAHAGGWVDLGNFSHKHSREEAIRIRQSCVISGRRKNHTAVDGDTLTNKQEVFFIPYAANTNGLIHCCARAYSTLEAGVISEDQNFVNLMDESLSVEELQKKIIELFSTDHYPACEYCNGFNEASIRYEPAEQIER